MDRIYDDSGRCLDHGRTHCGTCPPRLTHAQYKRLRDMADGHLTLYASVRRYDEHTGRRLDQPQLLHVGYDRPDILDRDWWRPLLDAGLIALPAPGGGRRCTVTNDGRRAVADYPHRTEARPS